MQLVFTVVEDDFSDSVGSWYSNIYTPITGFVVLYHVTHHLRLQPCFMHIETQLIHPVVTFEAVFEVHLDNLVTSILVRPSRLCRLETDVIREQHLFLLFGLGGRSPPNPFFGGGSPPNDSQSVHRQWSNLSQRRCPKMSTPRRHRHRCCFASELLELRDSMLCIIEWLELQEWLSLSLLALA